MLCFLLLKKNYKVRKKEKRKRKIIEFPKRKLKLVWFELDGFSWVKERHKHWDWIVLKMIIVCLMINPPIGPLLNRPKRIIYVSFWAMIIAIIITGCSVLSSKNLKTLSLG